MTLHPPSRAQGSSRVGSHPYKGWSAGGSVPLERVDVRFQSSRRSTLYDTVPYSAWLYPNRKGRRDSNDGCYECLRLGALRLSLRLVFLFFFFLFPFTSIHHLHHHDYPVQRIVPPPSHRQRAKLELQPRVSRARRSRQRARRHGGWRALRRSGLCRWSSCMYTHCRTRRSN
jgi:hypothetical protein